MATTPLKLAEKIVDLSKSNDMFGLITIHDEMLKENISIVVQSLRFIRTFHESDYHAFYSASCLSKVEKKGIFNKIVANASKREGVTN